MSGKITAARYARALYETAVENNILDTVTEDILVIDKIFNEIPQIKKYCRENHADKYEETKFIKTAFVPYVSEITGALLLEAVKNGRLISIPFFPAAFRELSESMSGRINVTVETAQEPEDSLINTIALKMEKRTGKKPDIKRVINPEILGGFRIFWQNRFIDMSVKGRLRELRSQFLSS